MTYLKQLTFIFSFYRRHKTDYYDLYEIEVQRDGTKSELDKSITYSQVVTPPFAADNYIAKLQHLSSV